MLRGPCFLVLVVLILLAAPVQAGEEERIIPLKGQVGPYWEHEDLHVDAASFKGSVPLRVDESSATVDLVIEDRSVGLSKGYVVRFCQEACGLSHDGPSLARATGMGPFSMSFPVDDLDVLHYRVSVEGGMRVDAHISGALVLSGDAPQESMSATSVTPAMPAPHGAALSSLALAVGVMGLLAVSPQVTTWVRQRAPWVPLAALFTRRETLLDHPVRKRIHDLVRRVPGIHLRELRREMSMPPGQVEHHLQKLVQGGYVVAVAGRGYTAHFLPGAVDRPLMAALAQVKSDAARGLLLTISEGDHRTLGAAARQMGIALSTASYHMGALERLDLVEVRDDHDGRWRVTALGRAFLDQIGHAGSGSTNGPESA